MYTRELIVGIPQGTLIDIETTGLDERRDEIIVFGYIERNNLRIICRRSIEEKPFITELVDLVPKLSTPFYAYNSSFEEKFLRVKGIRIKAIDLFRPWKEKAERSGLKWPKLDELFSQPEQYFREPIISGKDVPLLWRRYLETGDERNLQRIIWHNEADLLREMYLLVHYPTGEL
jgi:uncharacterized protein YprB with RNaseH-like and TPR domain